MRCRLQTERPGGLRNGSFSFTFPAIMTLAPPHINAGDDCGTWPETVALVRLALSEDVGAGDATTIALVPEAARTRARIVTRKGCRVAGLGVGACVFRELDPRVLVHPLYHDGEDAPPGAVLVELHGPVRPMLAGERTALNFLQRLCGIATVTREYVSRVERFDVDILDTRKTTPGWRRLEKYSVACGGGVNHRIGLYDRILIKDNHRAWWSASDGGRRRLADAVREARRAFPRLLVEIEVESEEELLDALEGGPDWVMIDNRPPDVVARWVELIGGRCRVELSGGITLENIAGYAAARPDAISVGALTHSAPASDLSLEFDR